jgi:hypothetical protein
MLEFCLLANLKSNVSEDPVQKNDKIVAKTENLSPDGMIQTFFRKKHKIFYVNWLTVRPIAVFVCFVMNLSVVTKCLFRQRC